MRKIRGRGKGVKLAGVSKNLREGNETVREGVRKKTEQREGVR